MIEIRPNKRFPPTRSEQLQQLHRDRDWRVALLLVLALLPIVDRRFRLLDRCPPRRVDLVLAQCVPARAHRGLYETEIWKRKTHTIPNDRVTLHSPSSLTEAFVHSRGHSSPARGRKRSPGSWGCCK